MEEKVVEIYTTINKMDGGFLVSRNDEDGNAEQKIFTNLNKAIAWIKEVLVDKE
jgi:hypothetical protein